MISSVSSYYYHKTLVAANQNSAGIVSIDLNTVELGPINEGDRKTYTKNTVPSLGECVKVNVLKQPVYLLFDSNLDSLSTYYSTFIVKVRFTQVQGSTYSEGDIAIVMTINSPDPVAVPLDSTGLWKFDFEIITSANSVNSDTNPSITIHVCGIDT
jgi:hypothetical protein